MPGRALSHPCHPCHPWFIPCWARGRRPGRVQGSRFKVQGSTVQRFEVQRFKVQRFKVQRFKVQAFKGTLSSRLPVFPVQKLWQGATLLTLLSPVRDAKCHSRRAKGAWPSIRGGRYYKHGAPGELLSQNTWGTPSSSIRTRCIKPSWAASCRSQRGGSSRSSNESRNVP